MIMNILQYRRGICAGFFFMMFIPLSIKNLGPFYNGYKRKIYKLLYHPYILYDVDLGG